MPFILANLIVDYFIRGGPIMWPILLALAAALTVGTERTLWWLRLQRHTHPELLKQTFQAITDGQFDKALELTTGSSDPFLRTVHDGLLNAHSSLLGAMQLRASDELEGGDNGSWGH